MENRTQKVAAQLEAAAKSAERHTRAGNEQAAHHLTAANAYKRGAAVPALTAKALKTGK